MGHFSPTLTGRLAGTIWHHECCCRDRSEDMLASEYCRQRCLLIPQVYAAARKTRAAFGRSNAAASTDLTALRTAVDPSTPEAQRLPYRLR